MKKILVHIILVAYVMALFRPAIAIAQDFLAHTFWKIAHISTVHYENGKYHLHQELANDASQQKNTSKDANTVSQYQKLANHLAQEITIFETYFSTHIQIFFSLLQHPFKVFIKKMHIQMLY